MLGMDLKLLLKELSRHEHLHIYK